MRCTACHAEIAKAGRFCPECAAPLVPNGDATETIAMRKLITAPRNPLRRTLSKSGHVSDVVRRVNLNLETVRIKEFE
jgi:hypothetical protein